MNAPRIDPTPSPEDSVRLALDELGRGTMASRPTEEDSAFIPHRGGHRRCAEQAQREIARNYFPEM